MFQPLSGRLATLLLEQSGTAVEGLVSRDFTLKDMAARIGTTREMGCKGLYRFSDQGLIGLECTQFKFNEPQKLNALKKAQNRLLITFDYG